MDKKVFWACILGFALVGCGEKSSNGVTSEAGSAASSDVKAIEFVTTQDGKPLVIDAAMFDTPAAKEFLASGKNSYVGNADAIAKGKKVFQLNSCTACHGANAEGAVGPSLQGPNFKYAKNATNKGMFETIWHGTNGGMGAKGLGLMDPNDKTQGLKPDEVLQVQAWIRSHNAALTGNE